jgi:hypothetical protein
MTIQEMEIKEQAERRYEQSQRKKREKSAETPFIGAVPELSSKPTAVNPLFVSYAMTAPEKSTP